MNILFNGKKIVKWLIRLLPFFAILYFLICSQIAMKSTKFEIVFDEPLDVINYTWSCFEASIENIMTPIMDIPFVSTALEILDNILTEGASGVSMTTPLYFSFMILIYEICCSIIFLIFDVLNYMLTICNKFLNKGEELNE